MSYVMQGRHGFELELTHAFSLGVTLHCFIPTYYLFGEPFTYVHRRFLKASKKNGRYTISTVRLGTSHHKRWRVYMDLPLDIMMTIVYSFACYLFYGGKPTEVCAAEVVEDVLSCFNLITGGSSTGSSTCEHYTSIVNVDSMVARLLLIYSSKITSAFSVVGKSYEFIALPLSVNRRIEYFISTEHSFLKHLVQFNRSQVFKCQQDFHFYPEIQRCAF
jgi:hypothetical protein